MVLSLSMHNIYEFTVPIFIKSLGGLKNILDKSEAFAKEQGISEEEFLAKRLWPDMFPFSRQVQIASDNAKGAAARLAGIENPKMEDTEKTFAELHERIDKTIKFLHTVPKDMFADADTRQISLPYWDGKVLAGSDYARQQALPNFFFHVTTAYGIARNAGVPLGKGDFINGLSFINETV